MAFDVSVCSNWWFSSMTVLVMSTFCKRKHRTNNDVSSLNYACDTFLKCYPLIFIKLWVTSYSKRWNKMLTPYIQCVSFIHISTKRKRNYVIINKNGGSSIALKSPKYTCASVWQLVKSKTSQKKTNFASIFEALSVCVYLYFSHFLPRTLCVCDGEGSGNIWIPCEEWSVSRGLDNSSLFFSSFWISIRFLIWPSDAYWTANARRLTNKYSLQYLNRTFFSYHHFLSIETFFLLLNSIVLRCVFIIMHVSAYNYRECEFALKMWMNQEFFAGSERK